VTVEPLVFSVLAYLFENRNHVVSEQELIDAVWEGRIVSDDILISRTTPRSVLSATPARRKPSSAPSSNVGSH
jgi:DNA-binding winged helix-turn-helix (wHTH) protein